VIVLTLFSFQPHTDTLGEYYATPLHVSGVKIVTLQKTCEHVHSRRGPSTSSVGHVTARRSLGANPSRDAALFRENSHSCSSELGIWPRQTPAAFFSRLLLPSGQVTLGRRPRSTPNIVLATDAAVCRSAQTQPCGNFRRGHWNDRARQF
jgi:hypothetical protein